MDFIGNTHDEVTYEPYHVFIGYKPEETAIGISFDGYSVHLIYKSLSELNMRKVLYRSRDELFPYVDPHSVLQRNLVGMFLTKEEYQRIKRRIKQFPKGFRYSSGNTYVIFKVRKEDW